MRRHLFWTISYTRSIRLITETWCSLSLSSRSTQVTLYTDKAKPQTVKVSGSIVYDDLWSMHFFVD